MTAGCAEHDHADSAKEFDALKTRKPPAEMAAKPQEAPPIPDLQPILAAPPPPGVAQRLVTLSVTDPSIPVRDVLLEMARKVGIDLDLDPNISGGVIIEARERPFLEVIGRICDQANLRYGFKDNVLKVEVDSMYYETYRLDILTAERKVTTTIASSSNLSTMVQSGGSAGQGNVSATTVSGTAVAAPWTEISENIKEILANSDPMSQPITSNVQASAMPAAAAAPASPSHMGQSGASHQETPAPGGVTEGGGNGGSGGAAANAAQYATQTASAAKGGEENSPAKEPTASGAAAPAAGGANAAARFSVNKQAGLVMVFATAKQHKLVRAYLDKVISHLGAQVLIEAKVVEIELTSGYSTGVDWQALRQNLQGTGFGVSGNMPSTNTSVAIPTLPGSASTNPDASFSSPFGSYGLNAGFTTFGGDLAAMVNLLKTYGDIRTLSSPRLTVMNNEAASLKVANNQVYFKLQATVTSTPATTGSAASQTATFNSQLLTLPIGLIMTVQPSIDVDHEVVTLMLRPTVTAWPGTTVSDPAVALELASACGSSSTGACSPNNLAAAVVSAGVPIVQVREMESVVTVPSGAVVVMGGLMQELVSKNDTGVPGAGDLPWVGNLFKATNDSTQLTELVVFLKATVVRGPETVGWADRDTYKNYVHDPRPLGF
jgi:general secretion pathway protein D